MSAHKVVFIGAAGEMSRVAIEAMARAPEDIEFLLTDIRPELVEPVAKKLGPRAKVAKLDLYDAASLRATIEDASLVILGAGPYIRTSAPVIEACLELKIPYLDFDDDVESTEHALSLDATAKEAGIPIYVGCGASPGMSNVMAVDAANDLDTVERIDMTWLVGDERPHVGRAVLEHMLHISAGECRTWEDGRAVVHESFVANDVFPIIKGEPDIRLFETAHPEPVTLPRKYPEATRIRCYGGLHPAPLNGFMKGMGQAIEKGQISQKDAVDFTHNVTTGGLGNLAGWRIALKAMREQVKAGHATNKEFLTFIGVSAVRRTFSYKGGVMAQVYGTKDGRPAVSSRRTQMLPGNVMNNMGGVTGTPCAAFAVMALKEAGQRSGAFSPEDWADPKAFYDALEACGVPRNEIVEIF
jgi:saccharopine dehydrogenase-like NADP-dependent oxidoreductase